jgi:hypothetical protein
LLFLLPGLRGVAADAKKGSGRFLLVLLPALRGVAAEVEGG